MTLLRKELLTSLLAMLVFILALGVGYPLLVTGIGQLAFRSQADGELVHVRGKLAGSRLIGQDFALPVYRHGKPLYAHGVLVTRPDPRYFQTRPSGTTPADNAAATSFANYGPNSTVTEHAIAANIAAYIALNGPYYPGGLSAAQVPVDAADTSASGVDPDISVANARIQAYRVAAVRHLPLRTVDALVARYTIGRALGFLGEPSVDVLELNLALGRL